MERSSILRSLMRAGAANLVTVGFTTPKHVAGLPGHRSHLPSTSEANRGASRHAQVIVRAAVIEVNFIAGFESQSKPARE